MREKNLRRAHAVLAEVAGGAVGLALFYYTLNTFKLRPNIFLEDLFVDPEYRGAGLGRALMRHLARRAVTEGCGRIEWRVLNWNQPSIAFYRRLGAEPIEHWHTLLLRGDGLAALAEHLLGGVEDARPVGARVGALRTPGRAHGRAGVVKRSRRSV